MKTLHKYIIPLFSLCILFLVNSCDNRDDEITELQLARYMQVSNVTANVIDGTQVRLTWEQNPDADSYIVEFFANDEEMTFEGNPSYILENIQNSDLPYRLLSGLEGNTTYSIRVKATGKQTNDSKWSQGITITTEGEQLFYSINNEELTHESVIIRWQAGESVTHLLITGGDKQNERIELLQAEINAGEYKIEGLSSETTYTVKLMNQNNQRGELSFTTGINLEDAIEVKADDDFQSMINSADPGSRFYLSEAMYIYSSEITVNKSISIVSGGNATISAQFKLTDGASISLQNLTLDGLENFDAVLVVNTDDQHGSLSIENCIIKNYKKRLIDSSSSTAKAIIASISINECIISDIPGDASDFIDFRNTKFDMMSITNSTFYNIYSALNRDFIRADNSGTDRHKTIQISNCTFNNIISTGKRFLYVRGLNDITFTNNIIANSSKGYYNDNSATQGTTFDKNVYYLADLYMMADASIKNPTNDTSGTVINPEFADPESGDFTVTNEEVYFSGAGDPRWIK